MARRERTSGHRLRDAVRRRADLHVPLPQPRARGRGNDARRSRRMKLTRVLLVGAGRSHLEVLRHLARRRDAALEITLASPEAQPLHAPMLPGVIAGDLAPADARLDLSGFARGAGMRFVPDQVASVDLYTRIATLESGEFVPFDVLSLDTGALPERTLAAAGHAIAIRPVRDFLAAWERLRQDVGKGEINTLTVVGGGAIAIELVLAMHRRLAR